MRIGQWRVGEPQSGMHGGYVKNAECGSGSGEWANLSPKCIMADMSTRLDVWAI